MKNIKLKEILGPLKEIINIALPLMKPPPLHEVRGTLLFEFPYAADVIDFVLTDLIGRTTARLRPHLVGEPGGGKSLCSPARRGAGPWCLAHRRITGGRLRVRRHGPALVLGRTVPPFLAIGQTKHANPLVLLDELEKAGTRNDYGRLWDRLLGFLEPETNARYPDPALQAPLDLSHVSYVAAANALDPLPSPIRDRFRRSPSRNRPPPTSTRCCRP